MRMKYSSFQFLLSNIERNITPMELAKSGLKPVSLAERLALTLRSLVLVKVFDFYHFSFVHRSRQFLT